MSRSAGRIIRHAALAGGNIRQYAPGTILFDEEFTGTAGADVSSTRWSHDVGRGGSNDGFGNNEQEYYTAGNANTKLDGQGRVMLLGRKETAPDNDATRPYTSARIKTADGKFIAKPPVRLEAKIATLSYAGLWPAFWTLGEYQGQHVWPGMGEIDIFEGFTASGVDGFTGPTTTGIGPKASDPTTKVSVGQFYDTGHDLSSDPGGATLTNLLTGGRGGKTPAKFGKRIASNTITTGVTAAAIYDAAGVRSTSTVAGDVGTLYDTTETTLSALGMNVGDIFSASAYVRTAISGGGRVEAQFFDSTNTYISQASGDFTANGHSRILNATIPAGTVSIRISTKAAATASGQYIDSDGFIIVAGAELPLSGYADGDFPYCSWAGTAYASRSTIPAPVFHTYGVDWTSGKLAFRFDGTVVFTLTRSQFQAAGGSWPFDTYPHYLLLNQALGGSFGSGKVGNIPAGSIWREVAMLVESVKATAL